MALSIEEKKARNRAAQKKYRETHPQKNKSYQNEYRANHKQEKRKSDQSYYHNNQKIIKENRAEYYRNNAEEIKQRTLNYYYDNKDGSIKQYRNTPKYIDEHNQYNQKYYTDNTEQEKLRQQEYSKTLGGKFRTAKGGAKKRNIIFELLFEDFSKEVVKPCYYCNNYFRKEVGCGGGLDRVDNSQGYILSNVVSCCAHCNYLKNKCYSAEQTKAMVSALIELDKK